MIQSKMINMIIYKIVAENNKYQGTNIYENKTIPAFFKYP